MQSTISIVASTKMTPQKPKKAKRSIALSKRSHLEAIRVNVCDDAQDLKGIDSAEDKESDDKTDGDDQNEADQDSAEDRESEDKTDGADQNEADQAEWTHVSRRRRRVNLPQCWKLRFPAHLRAGLHTPSESSSSASSSEVEMTLFQLP